MQKEQNKFIGMIEKEAKRRPDVVAALIKYWLEEDEPGNKNGGVPKMNTSAK